jgi:eukaryotic-like serine/threonine-protein kinase
MSACAYPRRVALSSRLAGVKKVTNDEALGLSDTIAQGMLELPKDIRPASLLARGTQIDQYEVLDYRGAGAMAVVYRGRDRRLGRDVAIKLLKTGEEGSTACGMLCSLLLREARILATLSHPNIIAIHDVGSFRDCVYIAMEYVDGETLAGWAARSNRSWRQRLDALLAAGLGLASAHEARVIHGDFKPENVLVSADLVKVTDFGVARAPLAPVAARDIGCGCGGPDVASCAIEPNAAAGTIAYMAPELLAGGQADTRTDQFSFAVSAWEVLYGSPPFTGDDIVSIYTARLHDDLAAPPAHGGVPEAIATILSRALRSGPSRRYVSMTDLLKRLKSAAD